MRKPVYEELARLGHATASPQRLHILNLLAQCERSVEELAAETSQSIASTSAHLKVLRACHLVESRKDGRHVRCRLANTQVLTFWLALRALGESTLPELQQYLDGFLTDRQTMLPLDGPALLEQARRGEVLVLDTRPEEEFRAGHIPHARSIPFPELEQRINALPRRKTIVTYCRGPYCVMARDSVATLLRHGLRARRLHAGMAEWRALRLPVEQ